MEVMTATSGWCFGIKRAYPLTHNKALEAGSGPDARGTAGPGVRIRNVCAREVPGLHPSRNHQMEARDRVAGFSRQRRDCLASDWRDEMNIHRLQAGGISQTNYGVGTTDNRRMFLKYASERGQGSSLRIGISSDR